MFKKFDSHIHFNMKAIDIVKDFKLQVEGLEGFILILNTKEEKKVFLEEFWFDFKILFPMSVIAINFELIDSKFIKQLNKKNIKLGIKLHPRMSNITKEKFNIIVENLKNTKFTFIIIDCFYYGASLNTHVNLELAIYISKHFKEKKILLAHAGGHKILEYMLYTRELKNIYYDLSLTSNYLKNTSVKQDIVNFLKYNYKRIFFGSDYPDFSVKSSVEVYLDLIDEAKLKDEAINLIFFDNIKQFLNIEVKNEK